MNVLTKDGNVVVAGGRAISLPKEKWKRPEDWPDLDSLNIPNDFVGAYYSIVNIGDHVSTLKTCFWGHSWIIDIGHIENGAFIVEETYTGGSYNQSNIEISGVKVARLYGTNVAPNAYGLNQAITTNSSIVEEHYYNITGGMLTNVLCERVLMKNCILTSFRQKFMYGYSLQEMEFINCKNTTDGIDLAFIGHSGRCRLQELDLSWVTKVSTWQQLTSGCTYLKTLDLRNAILPNNNVGWHPPQSTGIENLYINFPNNDDQNLSSYLSLTRDSALYIINHLSETETPRTLTLANVVKLKLTTEEIAIATQKGWTVA